MQSSCFLDHLCSARLNIGKVVWHRSHAISPTFAKLTMASSVTEVRPSCGTCSLDRMGCRLCKSMRAEKVDHKGKLIHCLDENPPVHLHCRLEQDLATHAQFQGVFANRSGWSGGPVEAASGGRVDRTGACVGSGAQAVLLGAFIKKGYY
jgi:hypothetical protein